MSHLLASEPFLFFSAQNTSVSRLTFLAHVLSSVSPSCMAVPFHFLTHLALLLRILGFKAFPHHYCSDLTFLFQIIHIISLSASFFPHPAQCSLLLSDSLQVSSFPSLFNSKRLRGFSSLFDRQRSVRAEDQDCHVLHQFRPPASQTADCAIDAFNG